MTFFVIFFVGRRKSWRMGGWLIVEVFVLHDLRVHGKTQERQHLLRGATDEEMEKRRNREYDDGSGYNGVGGHYSGSTSICVRGRGKKKGKGNR